MLGETGANHMGPRNHEKRLDLILVVIGSSDMCQAQKYYDQIYI